MTQAPDEREAIVRWLRERADVFYNTVRSAYPPHIITKELAGDTASRWGELQAVADAIERGEHIPSEQGEG